MGFKTLPTICKPRVQVCDFQLLVASMKHLSVMLVVGQGYTGI